VYLFEYKCLHLLILKVVGGCGRQIMGTQRGPCLNSQLLYSATVTKYLEMGEDLADYREASGTPGLYKRGKGQSQRRCDVQSRCQSEAEMETEIDMGLTQGVERCYLWF
jgi:hypothetical protein